MLLGCWLTSLVLRLVGSSVSRSLSIYPDLIRCVLCQPCKSPSVAACLWSTSLWSGTGKAGAALFLPRGPAKRLFVKEPFTRACLSSIFSQIFWEELSLDEIKTEVFSLPGLHPLFNPFCCHPWPHWYFCDHLTCCFTAWTPFAFPAIPHVCHSLGHNSGFFHGVWWFWSTFSSTKEMAVSFPLAFLHEPLFFWDS